MSNICLPSPYSDRSNPYGEKETAYSASQKYSDRASVYTPFNPYQDQEYCPPVLGYLLLEDGELVLQESGDLIII